MTPVDVKMLREVTAHRFDVGGNHLEAWTLPDGSVDLMFARKGGVFVQVRDVHDGPELSWLAFPFRRADLQTPAIADEHDAWRFMTWLVQQEFPRFEAGKDPPSRCPEAKAWLERQVRAWQAHDAAAHG